MIVALKQRIKNSPSMKRLFLAAMRIFAPFVAAVTQLFAVRGYLRFFMEWLRFKRLGGTAAVLDFYPCLADRTATTGIDTHYFHQAIWAFKRIMVSGAQEHVDVGSDVRFVGMLTTVTKVTFIDIRPLEIDLTGYTGMNGSIVQMPFPDRTLHSLSSMHVIEHVGLGRYGDPLDPAGSAKACAELMRVLACGGRLYISVPIGKPRVQFNGQRVFDPRVIQSYFAELTLIEFSLVNEAGRYQELVDIQAWQGSEHAGLDFGLGLFVFERR